MTFNLDINSEDFPSTTGLSNVGGWSYYLYTTHPLAWEAQSDLRSSLLTTYEGLSETCNTTNNFHQPGLPCIERHESAMLPQLSPRSS